MELRMYWIIFVLSYCFFIPSVYSYRGSGPFNSPLHSGALIRLQASGEIELPSSGKRNSKKYEHLLNSVEFQRTTGDNAVSMVDDPLLPMVHTVVAAADMRKANSMSAIRISHMTEITTFMIIIEGNSRPQNQAIANTIEEKMFVDQDERPSKQGSASSGWLVLDYGSLIVHIMTPQLRNFYKLEKRWKDAEEYDFAPFLAELYGVDRGAYMKKKNEKEEGLSWAENEVDTSRADAEDKEEGDEKEIDAFWS